MKTLISRITTGHRRVTHARYWPHFKGIALGVLSGMALAGCAPGIANVPTANSTADDIVIWSCALIDTIRNATFIVALLGGTGGLLLWSVSKFGAGIFPGGVVQFAGQAVQNNVSGLLMLIIGPAVFGVFLQAVAPAALNLSCQ